MSDRHRLEEEIKEWRSFVEASPGVDGHDVDELEDHLRGQVTDLTALGLAPDEALLIAVKRLGSIDELSREYAREHSGRLWHQLLTSDAEVGGPAARSWVEMLAFAIAAAIAVQAARLVAGFPEETPGWLITNASLFVLPFLAGYFVRRRGLSTGQTLLLTIPFLAAALFVNLYPFQEGGSTELLVAAHLPVALWLIVAYPYTGGELRSQEKRMDFVRFTGEWLIYYVLIALGGGVLVALTALILEPSGAIDVDNIFEWIIPSGAAGAVVVAAWLVESKQRVVENMAPVLTMVFTPLFALMLLVAVVVYSFTGLGGVFDRELLGVFDALLVVVLGLVLYSVSARDPARPTGWMDRIQLVAVLGALVLNSLVLGAMVARIGELGFTPNRTAALGLNLVLLVNLAGAAWLSIRLVAGRVSFHALEHWQTTYLPVFLLWAAAVVVVLPPLFSFS
jgi:hypothetical protein